MSDSAAFDRLAAALADRYRLERELGSGGMATVYLAEDLKHHRQVAIKVLKPELAAVLGPERFLREIEISAGLHHPHILPLYDSGEADGFLYYVMPCVEGESLRDRLRREKQLPLDDALQVAREAADALSYAHSHNVVHRDIKPENILLEAGHAVVADFGIARAISAAGGGRLTETGLAIGTPAYMSPEQAAGSQELDGRSDLYSLGCVLHEMLAGQPPFTGPTVESIVHQHLTVEPPNITGLRPAVPGWVAAALSRALAKTPADRFSPVALFAEVLARRESAIGATAVATAEAPTRHMARVGALGLAAAAVLGLGWWGVSQLGGAGGRIQSLVVLPLENLSGDPAREYFVDGMHDALIGELGRISALRVVSRTSAMRYKGTGKTVPEIARELNVDAVIEGTVFPAGDTVRIQVQLIRARPERQLWAAAYARDLRNVVGVLGEVAGTIAEQIQVTLTPQEVAQLATQRIADPVAQDHYLRGRQLLYRRTPEGILGSIGEFQQALRSDSKYAPAYAARASAYGLVLALRYARADSTYVWAARSLASADRAVEIDSLNAEGYAARGYLALFTGAPAAQIEGDFLQALRLKPSYAEAHGWYAQFLAQEGRGPEGLAAAQRAIELDPLSPGMRMGYSYTAWLARHHETQLEQARAVRALNPELDTAWWMEALALLALGRAAECVELARVPAGPKAMCLHTLGRTLEAKSTIDALIAAGTAGRGLSDDVMMNPLYYYAWIGQLEETIRWAERNFERSPVGINIGERGVFFDRVRGLDQGRFGATVQRLRREAWNRIVAESRAVKLP